MKQYELAVGLQAEGNLPGAFKTLYGAIEIDEHNARAHLLLANLFLLHREDNHAKYDGEAEKHFRTVIEIQSGEHRSSENLAADAHNGLGVLYVHQGKLAEAIAELEIAAGDLFNREAYMAWGNLGWAYNEQHAYPKAIESLLRAVKLRRDFCVGHFRLAQAFLATKEHEKAEQSATNAIEADRRCDTFQDAWLLRGQARMTLGRRDDAHGDFERCVELQPKSDAGKACARYLEATY